MSVRNLAETGYPKNADLAVGAKRLGYHHGSNRDENDPRRGKRAKMAIDSQLDGFAIPDLALDNGIHQMVLFQPFVLDGKGVFFFFYEYLIDEPGFCSLDVAHGNEMGPEIAGDFPISCSVINHLEFMIRSVDIDFSLDVRPAVIDGPQGVFTNVAKKLVIHKIDIHVASCDVSCTFL